MSFSGNPDLVDPGLDSLPANPMIKVQACLQDARTLKISGSNTLIVSTVNPHGQLSSRAVIVKDCDHHRMTFGTNGRSVKGRDLENNPNAAGTFWWRETIQQINFQGSIVRCTPDESDDLFRSRPRDAQAVASVSQQSATLQPGEESAMRARAKAIFDSGATIARPENWHAYAFTPTMVEFWYGAMDRFDIRIRYDFVGDRWTHQRLQP